MIQLNVFIAGPRAITKLNKNIEDRLFNIYKRNFTVVVGDAIGIDKAIQQYFYNLKYSNVHVYATQGKARHNIGNWAVENVIVEKKLKGFDYYAAKDLKMAEIADYGFMIWNGKSKGTLNNVINLTNRNKKTLIYFVPDNKFYCIRDIKDLEPILEKCDENTRALFKELKNKTFQLSFSDINSDISVVSSVQQS